MRYDKAQIGLLLSIMIAISSLIIVSATAKAQVNERDLVVYIADCWRSHPDFDDCIKPHIDLERNELGFRIGAPILRSLIENQPEVRVKNTDYNKIKAHNFHLKAINSTGLNIGYSFRWEKFEDNPFYRVFGPETYKRAEVNCDGSVTIRVSVDASHRIVTTDRPLLSAPNCNTSGFGVEEVFDYMTQGLTWIVSRGETSFGLYDLIGGFATVTYDFFAGVTQSDVTLTQPIRTEILSSDALEFVSKLHELNASENEIYLDALRYDAKGIWLIFSYPEWLERVVTDPVSLVLDTQCNSTLYVDATFDGAAHGTATNPFHTLASAYNFACGGAEIRLSAGAYSAHNLPLDKPVLLTVDGDGLVTIGK